MNTLICLHPGFEEIEAIVPIDLLSRAEVNITQAATSESLLVKGRSGISVQTDCLLNDCAGEPYDLVILPGGPGIAQLRNDSTVCSFLRAQVQSNKWIGCICAAPLLLKDAGLSEGLKMVCHPSAEAELGVKSTSPVATDGKVITSRGAGTATEFALALVEALKGRDTATAIAESICWSHDF